MTNFKLDERLAADCHQLTVVNDIIVLLLDNALVPWFVLVPRTTCTELHQLPPDQRNHLQQLQDSVCTFIEQSYAPTKLNVAAIGNIVRQMHIHIIGRTDGDYCWPGVVWGNPERKAYTQSEVADIITQFLKYIES